MSLVLKSLLCLQAWFALQASAARSDDFGTLMLEEKQAGENYEPELKTLLKNAPEAICGGANIWDMITGSRSLDSIQNIKWEKIQKTGGDFIEEQKQEVATLEVELKHLADRIKEKQKQAALKDASPEQIREMITSAIANEKSFVDMETAQRTRCGVPTVRPRAPRPAYKESQTEFKTAAEEFFESGEHVLEGDTFGTECEELLSCGGEPDCYCAPLCQKFRDIAQAISDEKVGAKGSGEVDKMLQEQSDKQSDLDYHKLQLNQCEEDLLSITAFGEQIQELKEDMKVKEEKVMDAEWALEDAMYSMEAMEDTLVQEEKVTEDLLEEVQEAGADFKQVADAFAKVQEDEAELLKAKEKSAQALEEARKKLEDARSAEAAVTKLKMAVSATMANMRHFFKEAVQTPVEFIGFEEDMDLFPPFNKDPWEATLEGVKSLRDSVGSLHGVCDSEETKQHFSEVAEKIDLSPLCAFEEPDAIEEDLRPAVTDSWTTVLDEVRDVLSWLKPFKGQPELTEEMRQEYLAAGEPDGFREIAGVYHDASFFNYLKDWKAGGPFLELISKLQESVSKLDESVQTLVAEGESLQEQMDELMTNKEAAAAALKEAEEKNNLAIEKKEAMEQKMAQLEEQSKALKEQYEELKAQLEEARAKHKEAKETLMASHEKATSMLQAFRASGRDEKDARELLRVRRAEASEQVRRLQRLLTAAKRSERSSAARLRSF